MLSGLGQYAGSATVTLIDGTVIQNPGSTSPTADQCTPYQCGADQSNHDAYYWCGFWGRGGNVQCEYPQCAPYRASIPACNIVAPTPQAPNPPQPPTPPVVLTPANVVQPMPNITVANTPVPVKTQDPSCWCQLNQFINDNPLIAVLALAGVAMIVLPKGGRSGR
jgi:hypothetical protein